MGNLLKDKDIIVIKDFDYVRYNNSIMYVDYCEIYKGCGILFFKDNNLVMSISKNVEIVQRVPTNIDINHYIVKGTEATELFEVYLIFKSKKNKQAYNIGDLVVRLDDNSASKIGYNYAMNLDFKNNVGLEFIKKEYSWRIKEIREDIYFLIEKDHVMRWVSIYNIITLEQILDI